jgi:hypothetical protein
MLAAISSRCRDRVHGTRRRNRSPGVLEVVVGVALTALLGGLLVPYLKDRLDRRSEQFRSSVALVDTLASSLWAYWKFALRVAYYGRQGQRGSKDLDVALRRWDSDDAWQIGCEIQIQVSRSKRLLPEAAQQKLDKAQRDVVDYLDHEIDRLRDAGTPDDWRKLYASLMAEKREAIDSLLTSVTADLKIGGTPRQLGTGLARPTRAR